MRRGRSQTGQTGARFAEKAGGVESLMRLVGARLMASSRHLVAASLSTIMLFTDAAQAMTIVQFDKMAVSDQSDYMAALIEGAQKVLITNGQSDGAVNVHKLFSEVRPKNKIPTGVAEFETYLAHVRVLDAERYAKNHAVSRLEVEHAIILTLNRNGIDLPNLLCTWQINSSRNIRGGDRWPS